MGGFASIVTEDAELAKACKVAVNEVLAVQTDERVLIITNPEKEVFRISVALYQATEEAGGQPVLAVQPVRTQLDHASPEIIAAIATKPEVVLSISHEKMGKDSEALKEPFLLAGKQFDSVFTYLLATGEIRSFWSPTVTVEMFRRTVPIDYETLRAQARELMAALEAADEVRVTAPSGTDITIDLRGRSPMADDGDFKQPGRGGNLPCGEVFISPALKMSQGVICFDGCISTDQSVILIEEPIRAVVVDGQVVGLEGGQEARLLQETLDRARETTNQFVADGKIPADKESTYLSNITHLGELGIGLNGAARIVGNMLEDEKVKGTCHIAIGANYDGDAPALIHLDGLIRAPTIVSVSSEGERVIMKDGEMTQEFPTE